MHTYFVSYMHMRGPETTYGNAVYTLQRPLDSSKAIGDLTAVIQKDKGLPNLQIMGIFPVKD